MLKSIVRLPLDGWDDEDDGDDDDEVFRDNNPFTIVSKSVTKIGVAISNAWGETSITTVAAVCELSMSPLLLLADVRYGIICCTTGC